MYGGENARHEDTVGFQRVIHLIPHSFSSQHLSPCFHHCLWDGLLFQLFPSNLVSSPVTPTFKDPPANAGDKEDSGSIPRLGRVSGGGKGNPLEYSCLVNPMGREAWWVTVQGATKSQTQLSNWAYSVSKKKNVYMHFFFKSVFILSLHLVRFIWREFFSSIFISLKTVIRDNFMFCVYPLSKCRLTLRVRCLVRQLCSFSFPNLSLSLSQTLTVSVQTYLKFIIICSILF